MQWCGRRVARDVPLSGDGPIVKRSSMPWTSNAAILMNDAVGAVSVLNGRMLTPWRPASPQAHIEAQRIFAWHVKARHPRPLNKFAVN